MSDAGRPGVAHVPNPLVQTAHGLAMDGRAAEAARTLPQQVALSLGRQTQGSRIHRFRPWRTGGRRARSHQRGNARMKQIAPHRNRFHRASRVIARTPGSAQGSALKPARRLCLLNLRQRRAFAIALFVLDVDVLISAGFRSSMNTVILPFRPTSTPNANRAFAIRPLGRSGRRADTDLERSRSALLPLLPKRDGSQGLALGGVSRGGAT